MTAPALAFSVTARCSRIRNEAAGIFDGASGSYGHDWVPACVSSCGRYFRIGTGMPLERCTKIVWRALRQIDSYGMRRIVIVVGYRGQKLKEYISTLGVRTRIEYVDNDVYDTTNNIYSLALAQEQMREDDTLLFESDLIVEDEVIDMLVRDPRPSLALVAKYEPWMDGTCVTLIPDDKIREFVPGTKFRTEDAPYYYKTVNIYKFSKSFSQENYVPEINSYMEAFGRNDYYERVLGVLAERGGSELEALRLTGQKWYEIDNDQDLAVASSMFV